ncbi:hypothetical protein BGW80DRAFT_1323383 [Lactifluus volemus]|nr:hypothetical protein BGW80DRAFT_1323383 [Lactifluus volemus]
MSLVGWISSALLADIGYSFNEQRLTFRAGSDDVGAPFPNGQPSTCCQRYSDCLVLGARNSICFPFITFIHQLPIDKFHIYHKPALYVTRHELPWTSRACHTTVTPSSLCQSVLRW